MVRVHPRCGHTLGYCTRHCLALVGFWLGLGCFHVGARPKFSLWVGFCLAPLRFFALCFHVLCLLIIFPCISHICPTKYYVSNTCGNMLIVKAYVLKVCLFLLFWILIGDHDRSLVTANT
jgi:hypothetical protein